MIFLLWNKDAVMNWAEANHDIWYRSAAAEENLLAGFEEGRFNQGAAMAPGARGTGRRYKPGKIIYKLSGEKWLLRKLQVFKSHEWVLFEEGPVQRESGLRIIRKALGSGFMQILPNRRTVSPLQGLLQNVEVSKRGIGCLFASYRKRDCGN